MSQFPLTRYRLNTSDYHRMIEAGILTERDHVELIHGEIVEMSPNGSKHTSATRKILTWLPELVSTNAQIQIQDPIVISDNSEPAPDIVLVKNRDDFYVKGHPMAADIILVVEVADSSLAYDREIKGALYAAAGISEYWILDLQSRIIEVLTEPSGERYKQHRFAEPGEQVIIPQLKITTSVEDWLI
ncbi:MAG: Uma2 family endonuclease [Bacteroidia bacterium]